MSVLKSRIEAKLKDNNIDTIMIRDDENLSAIMSIFMNFLLRIHPHDRPEINLYDMHINLFIQDPTQEIMSLLSRTQCDYYNFMFEFYLNNCTATQNWMDEIVLFLADESMRLTGMIIYPSPDSLTFLLDSREQYVKYFDICFARLKLALTAIRKPLATVSGGISLLKDVSLGEDLAISLGQYEELKKEIHAYLRTCGTLWESSAGIIQAP